ncbi:uncharacterized protein L201_004541 [Kwoniella dendrophila CBS 6074]|uniref:RNA polymerase II assembly factor Rtp1 C-terminal domain-containing protein n=1 Tax=Kwoniella dendrophila CBS 6074 TaxID=1295534 RepID=A0AAX4JWH1_9TREE
MPPRSISNTSIRTTTGHSNTTNSTNVTLKSLLKSSDILLKPPQPLSSNPQELIQRLRSCSKSLPKEWRKLHKNEWSIEDEQEQIGDNDPTGQQDEERKKRRRDELIFIVGKRCFILIKSIQSILEKEFWPDELKDGLTTNDFLLGTADLRLIRLMLSHTTFSYLLPLVTQYAEQLPNVSQDVSDKLSTTLDSLLKLLKTSSPPIPIPVAGPSSRIPTPPTTITQTLLTSHLIPIFLSTLIIAYTPSIKSEIFQSLRSEFIKSLMSLSPGQSISTLVNVLKLLVQGNSNTNAKKPPNGWVRIWPKYPKEIINGLLTAQVRRPGGVRGLMENVLGETAKTDDVTSIEGQRLDHIFNVLIRIPRQVTPEIYYPWLLSELFAMIPLTSHSHLPVAYVNTACYCIQRLWASNKPLIGDWLKNKLFTPWYPKLPRPPSSSEPNITVTTWEAIQRSVQNMRLLLLHNPTSTEFSDFLVGSILPPLFSLYTFLTRERGTVYLNEKNPTDQNDNSIEEGVQSLLINWGKSVDEEAGVRGIWSIVESENGWAKKEGGSLLKWERCGDGVKLIMTHDAGAITSDIVLPTLPTVSSTEEEQYAQLLSKRNDSPDAQLLCQYIESLDRPDIASEVILKSLDSWRINLAAEKEPSMESLSNLQLTIQMMEKLGSQLFTKPSQVLGFVERVLNDQVQSPETSEARIIAKKPVIIEVSTDGKVEEQSDDDAVPDGQRGLIEVACQLLASLESEGQLKNQSLIIQPIMSHLDVLSQKSPSVSIRNAAREAQLLLSQQDEAIDGIEPTSKDPKEISLKSYERAVELINDPTLPVKAHGMAELKQLVHSSTFDTSLTSNILEVFFNLLDGENSFIYTLAIKGLSEMVDALGKDIFRLLSAKYINNVNQLKNKNATATEYQSTLDRVLRIGEAIDQVAEQSADLLGQYADEITPTLMSVYPISSLPTIIRSSALSILSTCARVSPLTILPWALQLAEDTLDLIQIESVTSSPFKPAPLNDEIIELPQPKWGKSKLVQLVDDEPLPEEPEEVTRQPSKPRIVDEEPTNIDDNKHPTLRRAALSVFDWSIRVSLFLKYVSTEKEAYNTAINEIKIRLPDTNKPTINLQHRKMNDDRNDSNDNEFSDEFIKRSVNILGYVMKFDQDEIVRQHAENALRDLNILKYGTIGEDIGLDNYDVDIDIDKNPLDPFKSLRIS